MTSRTAVLPSGRPEIQSLTRVGTDARIRKLLNRMAPISTVKIIAVVFTVSISDVRSSWRGVLRLIRPSTNAPQAPTLAASVGENQPT